MHDLILWIQEVLVPRLGWLGMFLVTAADTSFVPLPELADVLMVTGAARHPGSAWQYVLAMAGGSVAGCQLVYEVARRGGEALATRFVSAAKLLRAEALLSRWGAPVIAVAAMSPPPMPFKGFVLAAGIFAMSRWRFALTIFVGRGLRYAALGLLGATYGDEAIGWVLHLDDWVQSHPAIMAAILGLIVIGFVLWWRSHHELPPAAS